MRPIQRTFRVFSLNKNARAYEKGGTRSQDGALSPFFEGITPPQKIDPKKWRQPWRHNLNPVKLCFDVHCNSEISGLDL